MTDAADAGTNDELERLRADNAALRRRLAWRDTARRASVVVLLILGCGLAALAVLAIWLRVTLLDTDRYVDTVAPIAAEPAVQKAVADKLDTAITTKIDFNALAREVLPERADVLAPALAAGAAARHPLAARRLHAPPTASRPCGRRPTGGRTHGSSRC